MGNTVIKALDIHRYSLAFVTLIPSRLGWAEIEYTVHVSLPKRTINQLSKQQ